MASRYDLSVQASAITGRGLFTNQPILAGSRVLTLIRGAVAPSRAQVPTRNSIPDDAIFDDYSTGEAIYDVSFQGTTYTIPRWYYLNHSESPNLRPGRYGNTVVFRSISNIHSGDELTFNYQHVPAAWNNKAPAWRKRQRGQRWL